MTSTYMRALACLGLGAALAGPLYAQGWAVCDAPMNPHSNPYITNDVNNILMRAVQGDVGTTTHGGSGMPPGPCWDPAITGDLPGGLAFSNGPQGGTQSYPGVDQSFDDDMSLVYGAPFEPGIPWCFGTVNVGNTRTAFASGGIGSFFNGASGRYIYQDATIGSDFVKRRIDVLGDASRMMWTFTNEGAAQETVGIWFGGYAAQISNTTGETSGFGDGGYVLMPGREPVPVEMRLNRNTDQNFPATMDFWFDQAHPYGFRVDNGPTLATSDQNGLNSDADFIDEVAIGDPSNLIGGVSGNKTFNDVILPDAPIGLNEGLAFLQKMRTKIVQPLQSVTFVHYFHLPWAVSNYSDPYSVVSDAPLTIAGDSGQPSGLFNDGAFTLAVNVDNSGRPGFAEVGSVFPITAVRVAISFPNQVNGDPNGLSLASGESPFKNIPGNPALNPLQMKSVSFNVVADGINTGAMPYTVTVTPSAGPVKTIHGVINVAATPRVHLLTSPSANLITAPWNFTDSSWEAVLGIPASQFQAFTYDPQQNGYVLSSSAERGIGTFIIYTGSDPSINDGSAFMQSNPQPPAVGATIFPPQVRLHSGWNLIGSPYQYPVPLSEVVGVSDADNTQALTWQQLVNAGIVANFLAFWDSTNSQYNFIQDINSDVQPKLGYWVFVQTAQDLTLQFPPVFTPGIGSGGPGPLVRLPHGGSSLPGNLLWKIQLKARNNTNSDSNNFVGSATDAATAQGMLVRKPPMSPISDLSLGIVQSNGAQNVLYAQALGAGTGPQTFTVQVSSKRGGPVNLTWPNIAQKLPAGYGATITDTTAHIALDMRRSSSYSLSLPRGGTRTLTVKVQPVSTGGTIISSLTRANQGSQIDFSYRLSPGARVSAKIVTSNGADVATLEADHQEGAGLHHLVWNLRDSQNHPVHAGSYVFVVTATADGQMDTKQLPFVR